MPCWPSTATAATAWWKDCAPFPDVKCTLPQGAFYAYPNVSAYLNRDGLADTTVLAEKLLDEAHVAVVPGPAFGTQQHLRLSYATSLANIDEGLRRMAAFFAKF